MGAGGARKGAGRKSKKNKAPFTPEAEFNRLKGLVRRVAKSKADLPEFEKKMGRPTDFKFEMCAQAAKLCRNGATLIEVADFFEVGLRTIYRWRAEHSTFGKALELGTKLNNSRAKRSVFERAVGYTFDSEKVFVVKDKNGKNEVIRVPIREHVPPDMGAAKLWFNNYGRKAEENWSGAEREERLVTFSLSEAVNQAIELRRQQKALEPPTIEGESE